MDKEIFLNLLKERILILDGGMGTMVQGFKLTEKDFAENSLPIGRAT